MKLSLTRSQLLNQISVSPLSAHLQQTTHDTRAIERLQVCFPGRRGLAQVKDHALLPWAFKA